MKKVVIGVVISSCLFSGVYLVPQEYDNLLIASRSHSYGVITNQTKEFSAIKYVIGGKEIYYRCLVVPKINCIASIADINANISESSLKDKSENLVNTFQIDLRLEDNANNWFICGAGYGGKSSHETEIETTDLNDGSFNLQTKYFPKKEGNYYFTNIENTSKKSYMMVTYSQTCI